MRLASSATTCLSASVRWLSSLTRGQFPCCIARATSTGSSASVACCCSLRWKSSSEMTGLNSVRARPRYRSRYIVSTLPASTSAETSEIGSTFICPSPACQHALRVSRDHELLVGRHHPRAHAAPPHADPWPSPRIGRRVQLDREPCCVPADSFADRHRVLADSAGEHDRVEPAERGRERAELPPDAVHVEVDGKLRGRRVGRQQSPHVAGDA